MPALQFATATANLASQNAFLFLATHGPIFIAASSSATLIQCGFQYPVFEHFH
jgi:predicted ATPase